jgi:hypothetical protein
MSSLRVRNQSAAIPQPPLNPDQPLAAAGPKRFGRFAMKTVLSYVIMLSVMLGAGVANAEQLRPYTCATGWANAWEHIVWPQTQGVNKAGAYLARAVFNCYTKPAGEKREKCIEKQRKRHYEWVQAFKFNNPDCLDKAYVMDSTVRRMRAFADRIFCDGGESKCQKAATRHAGTLAIRLIGLHMGYWTDFWQNGTCCHVYEEPAIVKFNNQLEKLPDDCPPCLDIATFARDLQQNVDDHNYEPYCASESPTRSELNLEGR